MRLVRDETVSPSELICLESETESCQEVESPSSRHHFLSRFSSASQRRSSLRYTNPCGCKGRRPRELLPHATSCTSTVLTAATNARAGTARQTIQQRCVKGIALHRRTPAKAKHCTHGRRWESNELSRSSSPTSAARSTSR